MTKLLAGKISTLIAAFTTSVILSGCETRSSGRPELCEINPDAAGCAKARVVRPKAKVVKPKRAVNRIKQNRNDY